MMKQSRNNQYERQQNESRENLKPQRSYLLQVRPRYKRSLETKQEHLWESRMTTKWRKGMEDEFPKSKNTTKRKKMGTPRVSKNAFSQLADKEYNMIKSQEEEIPSQTENTEMNKKKSSKRRKNVTVTIINREKEKWTKINSQQL